MESLRNQVAAQRAILAEKKAAAQNAEREREKAWEKTREVESLYIKESTNYFGAVGYCYDENKKKRDLKACYWFYRMYIKKDCDNQTPQEVREDYKREKESFAKLIKYDELPEINDLHESNY